MDAHGSVASTGFSEAFTTFAASMEVVFYLRESFFHEIFHGIICRFPGKSRVLPRKLSLCLWTPFLLFLGVASMEAPFRCFHGASITYSQSSRVIRDLLLYDMHASTYDRRRDGNNSTESRGAPVRPYVS